MIAKWVCASLLGVGVCAKGEVTSLNQPLQEETEILITCELSQAPKRQDIPVFAKAKDAEGVTGTYHYKLWLPKGYLADAQRRWPCLFIADPGGNASFGNMGHWLRARGYVVVMLQESKNGPWQPIVGNFLAAHDDVVKRVRIQEGLKMATGMSGGARAASVFAQIRPGFCGLLMQGAGVAYDDKNQYYLAGLKKIQPLFVVMMIGESDDNRGEVARMKGAFTASHLQVLQFPGGHIWAPTEVFDRGMEWIERQLYEEGTPSAALHPVYVGRVRSQLDELASVTAAWERYKLANSVLAFSRSRNVAMDPAVAPALNKLQLELTQLRTNPAITREVLAADALSRLEQLRDRTPPAMFVASCRNLARQYPGTEAAAKAEQLAGSAK